MPDVGKNAIKTWIASGSATDFVITFDYLDKADIVVKLAAAVQTRPSQWDFVGPSVVRFVTMPGAGTSVTIERVTPHTALAVTFKDGTSIPAADLHRALNQSIYYTEEIEDKT